MVITLIAVQITNAGDSPDRLDAGIKIIEANHTIVQNTQNRPLTKDEMDNVYSLPFERNYHTIYKELGHIPAIDEIKFLKEKYKIEFIRFCDEIFLAKGIGMTIVRTGAGIYEVVTFPFPIPEDYGPVLEPEFVFSEE